jgi:hypothetical protein
LIPVPDPELEEYFPIEFLYSQKILQEHSMLQKRNFNEFKNKNKSDTAEGFELLMNEYKNESSLRPFKINDDKKTQFADSVNNLSETEFHGFEPLLNLLEKMIVGTN